MKSARPTLFILIAMLTGCEQQRLLTISAKPSDAIIKVNGIDRGRGPVVERLAFNSDQDIYRITAMRTGFKDKTVLITKTDLRKDLLIELGPLTRTVYFTVQPVPANITIDGKPITTSPVGAISADLQFTVDERNNWTSHEVVAEAPGFRPARQTVSWRDLDQNYVLNLETMRKDLSFTTEPQGAKIFVDDHLIGTTPIRHPDCDFPVDPQTNELLRRKVRAEKPGYDPVEIEIGWDDGTTDYHLTFLPREKVVLVFTDPSEATVIVNGAEGQRRGKATAFRLAFPPTNDKGDLRVYDAVARMDSDDTQWEPATFKIGWDGGSAEYRINLKEVLLIPVPLLIAEPERGDAGWEMVPKEISTNASRIVAEIQGASPTAMVRLERGQSIGSMALAPDGSRIVFTVLSGKEKQEFRSVVRAVGADGSAPSDITDGKTLDITPVFTPGGDQILISSNRGGQRMQIWSMPAAGDGEVTRLNNSETSDIWPSPDSDPRPRLFYQAMSRAQPRIHVTPLNVSFQREVAPISAMQPRISPKNDTLLFAATNEKSGKRDIWKMSDKGGLALNLTNTSDADEFDATWNRDGRRIAFTSDRGTDPQGNHNYDIWIMDLTRPGKFTQLTSNPSHDDQPLFSPDGQSLYFRSNRGGVWGIWKMNVK